jgi:hypothetical protein
MEGHTKKSTSSGEETPRLGEAQLGPYNSNPFTALFFVSQLKSSPTVSTK